MKLGKKILLICIGVVLFFAAEYILYYIFHYVKGTGIWVIPK